MWAMFASPVFKRNLGDPALVGLLLIGAAFCFRRSGATDERLKVRLTSWATIFFGSGDFLTDVLFAKLVLSNGFFRCPTEGDSCAAIDAEMIARGLDECPAPILQQARHRA